MNIKLFDIICLAFLGMAEGNNQPNWFINALIWSCWVKSPVHCCISVILSFILHTLLLWTLISWCWKVWQEIFAVALIKVKQYWLTPALRDAIWIPEQLEKFIKWWNMKTSTFGILSSTWSVLTWGFDEWKWANKTNSNYTPSEWTFKYPHVVDDKSNISH